MKDRQKAQTDTYKPLFGRLSYLIEDEEETGDQKPEYCNETCETMDESEDREFFEVYDPCESCPLRHSEVTPEDLEEV